MTFTIPGFEMQSSMLSIVQLPMGINLSPMSVLFPIVDIHEMQRQSII
jgi:hypothetical protein